MSSIGAEVDDYSYACPSKQPLSLTLFRETVDRVEGEGGRKRGSSAALTGQYRLTLPVPDPRAHKAANERE